MFTEKTANILKTDLTMTQSMDQNLWIAQSGFKSLLVSLCYILGYNIHCTQCLLGRPETHALHTRGSRLSNREEKTTVLQSS